MRLDTLHTAETPEGIALSLRPAGLMARSLAYLIDLAIRLVAFIVLAIVTGGMGGVGTALMLVSYFALEWLYPVVFELSRRGATPGKRALGLRVVMDSGLPVTPAAALIRNLLRTADFLPALYGAGLTSMLLRRDSKRLGDLAAGTLVVFTDSVSLHGEVPGAEPLAPLRPLNMREQAAIVSWAGRTRRLTPERLEELALIAQSVLPAGAPGAKASPRLLGVAQWVLGRRNVSGNDKGARP
ncbi:RDD family protein [Variovorax rhizosphaerae]|uniref:RDD family protein n=1 Tax=Variovorax rhizosphaerae TaxID=1836200 RepID=A0ABU8WE23_9BURK